MKWNFLLTKPRRSLLNGCFPAVALAATCLMLSGCWFTRMLGFGAPDPGPEGPGRGDGASGFRIEDILSWMAWAFSLGGGALIAASILGAALGLSIPFLKFSPGRLAIAGFGLIIAGQILLWLGAALWWLSILALLITGGGLIVFAWSRRGKLETLIQRDLDGDGIIGDQRQGPG